MSDIPVIHASDYRSALHVTNLIHQGLIALPVQVKCGNSTFLITRPIFDNLSLGVLMGALWKELE